MWCVPLLVSDFQRDVLSKTWPPDGAGKYVQNIDKLLTMLNPFVTKIYKKLANIFIEENAFVTNELMKIFCKYDIYTLFYNHFEVNRVFCRPLLAVINHYDQICLCWKF